MAYPITIRNIHKNAYQRREAVRINDITDIPEFLRESIVAVFEQPAKTVRINRPEDIPGCLLEAIYAFSVYYDDQDGDAVIYDQRLSLNNEDGYEDCPMGSVVSYHWSDGTKSGWHCWSRTPEEVEAFFVEHDGVFYNRVNPLNLMANKDEKVVLLLDCVEGRLKCPMGSVIGYEKSAKAKSGWNCWCIDDADKTLIEKDGVFYTRDDILKAELLTERSPILFAGADIWPNEDYSWSYRGPWGVQTGFPGQAYWVRCGFTWDGIPKGYILTKSEESYKSFIVCDDDGNDLGYLCEIDPV